MASGAREDLCLRERVRWNENSKVYTRRLHKKTQKFSTIQDTVAAATSDSAAASAVTTTVEVPPDVTAAAVEGSNIRTAEDQNGSTAASSDTGAGVSNAAVANHENVNGNIIQLAEHVNFSPQRPLHREQTSPTTSVAQGADSTQQQLEEPRHQQLPLPPDGSSLTEKLVPEGGESQAAGQENISLPSPPSSENEHQNLRESTPVPRANWNQNLEEGSRLNVGSSPHNPSVLLPLISADEQPTRRQVSPPQLPMGNELYNDSEAVKNGQVNVNSVVKPLVITEVDDKVRFNLSQVANMDEVRELKKQLESELVKVRKLVKHLEEKQLQLAADNANSNRGNINNTNDAYMAAVSSNLGQYTKSLPKYVGNDAVERRTLVRVHSEVSSLGHSEPRLIGLARVNSDVGAARHQEPRLYNRQLSVAVMENHRRVSDFVEKEKRTPKANQYYRNSEFLLGKDRLPPESNKRLKTSNGRKHGRESEHAFGFDKSRNQIFRSCNNLLQRLMKHKHGWVFNEPVDAKALGLHDYHDIIKHPMDLGTIKNRLSQNWYKSPKEFAEDVRLVFRNAMTYNPKGQDVHVIAEQLSQIFEEKWAVIETEYNPYWKYQMYQDSGLPTFISRRGPESHFPPPPASVPGSITAPIASHIPSAPQMGTLDSSMSITTPMLVRSKIQHPHVVRTPVPKKPKAKDPNKRDMTYEEKQRLSRNLQSLPSEKLDAIVQIIQRRNTTVSQHDDEIEVDIDRVDPETLWELDRFVSNYKKNLSKHKRKAELALQARAGTNGASQMMMTTTEVPEAQKESGTGAEKSSLLLPSAQCEKLGHNTSRCSSSSSSSSDSGSSSSDSDSDSSSVDGSDAGQSPRT